MSGIFGFTIKTGDSERAAQTLHALDIWNRTYGNAASDHSCNDTWGIGCHVEHFSDRYSAGAPILRNGCLVAVIDAVLYNREELGADGCSDEEFLFRYIRERGYDALAQVNGDFAGAIYDEDKNTWTLFRDHMGVRPLYCYQDESIFAFSSDLRGLAAIPGADLQINEEKLYLRMAGFNDLTLCQTEFARINCIRPGSWTVVRSGKTEGHIYWKLGQKKVRLKRDEDYQAELRRLITDSVKRRLDAVPGIVGGELSGGLDSGVIDILISRLGREGRYYSWSYDPNDLPLREGDDERKIILDICAQEHISCKFTSLNKDHSLDYLFDELVPPYVNTRSLSEGSCYLKSQGANVVFTGHGGDEGVSHRCNLLELWHHREYLAFAKLIYGSTEGKKLRLLRTVKRMWHQITVVHPKFLKPYQNKTHNAAEFLNPDFAGRMEGKAEQQPLYFAYDPVRFVEQGGSRVRLDNVAYHGARNGVRYMIPFLDYRVIDFAVSIPRRLYVNGKVNRYIYREAFKDILPESLYTMQYKDSSSMRGFQPEGDIRKDFLRSKEEMLARLDRSFWGRYLDLEQLEQLTLPEDWTNEDYMRAAFRLDDIIQCLLLQNVKDNAGRWCEVHE